MYDIVAIGELLVDITETNSMPSGKKQVQQNAGGAPCNFLTAAARLGCSTAFIGKIGDDEYGRFLKQTIEADGICTDGLVIDKQVPTTLAFVTLDEKGERSFSFSRSPGADTCLTKSELKQTLLSNCRVFHFGSLSLTDEPARSTVIAAIHSAKESGAIISYDPNYRPSLWTDSQTAKFRMHMPLTLVDMIKVSGEELLMITDTEDISTACTLLHDKGIHCIVITLASDGAYVSIRNKGSAAVKGFSCPVVDTTGAGDAFWGTFIAALLQGGVPLSELTVTDAERYAYRANAAAGICIGRHGGIPAMPTTQEIENLLSQRQKARMS